MTDYTQSTTEASKSAVERLVMPTSLRLALIVTVFIFSGVAVEALELITEPAYWAFYGAVWG